MKLYLAGIKSYQLDLGINCSAFLDPRLERTIQGIKRDHGEPEHRIRTPLTRPHLIHILQHLQHRNYDNLVMRAVFTLAFAGFLPVGEFTYNGADLELGLSFANWFLTKTSSSIRNSGAHMELALPSSKTDPFRKGIKLTIAASYDEACAVQAMGDFLAKDTHRPQHAPLFCVGIEKQDAFTHEHVVQKLQGLARTAGMTDGIWNGHSFRRGAATWAAESNISETEIQTLGRWKSDAYKRYIEYSTAE